MSFLWSFKLLFTWFFFFFLFLESFILHQTNRFIFLHVDIKNLEIFSLIYLDEWSWFPLPSYSTSCLDVVSGRINQISYYCMEPSSFKSFFVVEFEVCSSDKTAGHQCDSVFEWTVLDFLWTFKVTVLLCDIWCELLELLVFIRIVKFKHLYFVSEKY